MRDIEAANKTEALQAWTESRGQCVVTGSKSESGEAYGGLCVFAPGTVSSVSCLEECQAMSGCVAASFSSVCRLFTADVAAPSKCPSGSSPLPGQGANFLESAFRVKYSGNGLGNGTKCWTNSLSGKHHQALPQAMLPAQVGRRWTGPSTTLSGVSLNSCKESCMLEVSCVAVSYSMPNGHCKLHTTAGSSVPDISSVSLTKCNTPLTNACPVDQSMTVFWSECASSSAVDGALTSVGAVHFDECKKLCDPLSCAGIHWEPETQNCSAIIIDPLSSVDSATSICQPTELDTAQARIYRSGVWLDGGPNELCAVSATVNFSSLQSDMCCTSDFQYLANHGPAVQSGGTSWQGSDLCSCATMCRDDTKCTSFTWDKSQGLCHLIDPTINIASRQPVPRASTYYFTRKTEGLYHQKLNTSCADSSMVLFPKVSETLSACLTECSASSWCRAVVYNTSGPTTYCQLVFSSLQNATLPCTTITDTTRILYVKASPSKGLTFIESGVALSAGQVKLGTSPMTLDVCKEGCILSNCVAFRCATHIIIYLLTPYDLCLSAGTQPRKRVATLALRM